MIKIVYLIVRHKVKDFQTWKSAFYEDAARMKKFGAKCGQIFRNINDRQEIIVFMEWDNMEDVIKFTSAPDLESKMKQGTVMDKPDGYFLEEVEKIKLPK